jgi:hypothetical protein
MHSRKQLKQGKLRLLGLAGQGRQQHSHQQYDPEKHHRTPILTRTRPLVKTNNIH